jgi:GNAT superfamily N-acetyltransferase
LANQMLEVEHEPSSEGSVFERAFVKFSEIEDPSSDEFEEAMRIYVASFPENERRPVASIKAMLERGEIRLKAGLVDDRVVFIALMYHLKGTPYVLGDYLATAEEYRGRGIGKQLLENVFSIMSDIQFDHFLIQVENPYLDDDEMKMRRVEFYKSLGMKELKGIRYILPPLQGTMPSEMILMVLSREDRDHLNGDVIRDIITQIFGDLDNRHEDDEFLVSTLREIPDLIHLA